MSFLLEMLQAAGRAPAVLGEATELVRAFFLGQQNLDGGFKDRAGRSDLYYTVFGLGGLAVLELGAPPEASALEAAALRARAFVDTFGVGQGLDLVHLCCLARVSAVLAAFGVPPAGWDDAQAGWLQRLEFFRCEDGGYHPGGAQATGSVYGAFLVAGAYQDLQAPLPEPGGLAAAVAGLARADGSWMNERFPQAPGRSGSTNATAAAVALLRHLDQRVPADTTRWLLAQCQSQGGFVAAPGAPMPDLLSTATALHALAGLGAPLSECREPCLDFVDSLWTNAGGFYGHWGDDALDCEYTFYGLLALGHLNPAPPA